MEYTSDGILLAAQGRKICWDKNSWFHHKLVDISAQGTLSFLDLWVLALKRKWCVQQLKDINYHTGKAPNGLSM